MSGRIVIVGAGWSGAVLAREFHDAGIPVEVLERGRTVGGHSRVETLNGVVYEPNGPHIFHTSDRRVADYVHRFGLGRQFELRVLTEIYLRDDDEDPRLMSWPPQVDELRDLPDWPLIEKQLANRPETPSGDNFEAYVVSLMGRRLYELFIEGYTRKQWGRDPADLSSRFAPKRVDLRDDGYTRLFRDRWEYFPAAGVNSIIEEILAPVPLTCGVTVTLDNVAEFLEPEDHLILTCPLDEFVGDPGRLEWRGIRSESRYLPVGVNETVTPAYIINRPSLRVPYTRTVETKHATGQQIAGTVVSYEYPGAPARHYPVSTPDLRNERINEDLQREIREAVDAPVTFTGRLANYTYINQDQAILHALTQAWVILSEIHRP